MSREMGISVRSMSRDDPGFRSSSQGQVNSAVAAKEHSRVHLCLGLALRQPRYHSTRLSALVRTGEDGMSHPNLENLKQSLVEQLSVSLKKCCVLLLMTNHGC
ncbi:unnamed protein product [Nezara viridula]|uniref:Uncharacterized protein n=1 Tax=Nezara viridula TaxID=85310 RepID=A0A9P0E1U6_NEZVI|nr:unnamed protein product [Nezara viridula]